MADEQFQTSSASEYSNKGLEKGISSLSQKLIIIVIIAIVII